MWHNSIKEPREKPLWFRQSPLLDSVGTTNKYITCWKMIKPQNVSLASGISLHPCRISSWDNRDNISPIITWAAVLFHACWEREGWGLSHFLEHANRVVLDCTVGRCFPRGLFTQLHISFGEKNKIKIRYKTIRFGFSDATFQVSWNDFGTECSCELCLRVISLSFWILVFLGENWETSKVPIKLSFVNLTPNIRSQPPAQETIPRSGRS